MDTLYYCEPIYDTYCYTIPPVPIHNYAMKTYYTKWIGYKLRCLVVMFTFLDNWRIVAIVVQSWSIYFSSCFVKVFTWLVIPYGINKSYIPYNIYVLVLKLVLV